RLLFLPASITPALSLPPAWLGRLSVRTCHRSPPNDWPLLQLSLVHNDASSVALQAIELLGVSGWPEPGACSTQQGLGGAASFPWQPPMRLRDTKTWTVPRQCGGHVEAMWRWIGGLPRVLSDLASPSATSAYVAAAVSPPSLPVCTSRCCAPPKRSRSTPM